MSAKHAGALLLLAALAAACGRYYEPLDLRELQDPDGWLDLSAFKYKGALRGGMPSGPGEALYPGGVVVRSTFRNGVAQGNAHITVPRYGRIEGTMRDGRLVRGQAVLDDGGFYTGEFRNFQFHGQGTLFQANDERFHGTFAQGRLHGTGVHFDGRTSTLVEGTFRQGAPDGEVRVERGGTAALKHFSNGRDVTRARQLELAGQRLTAPLRRQSEQAAAVAAREEAALRATSAERSRLQNLRTRSGVDAYNRECNCVRPASIGADGGITFGVSRCIFVEAPNTTSEQRRLARQQQDERRRSCAAWAQDINDPNMPARLQRLAQTHQSQSQALARAREDRRRAEAELTRIQAALRAQDAATRDARIQAELARVEREHQAKARAQAAERARMCTATSSICHCAVSRPLTSARPGSGARVSCQ